MRVCIDETFVKRVAELVDPQKSVLSAETRWAFLTLSNLTNDPKQAVQRQQDFLYWFELDNRHAAKTSLKMFDVNNDGIVDSQDLKWFSDNVDQSIEVELDETDKEVLRCIRRVRGRRKYIGTHEQFWERVAKEAKHGGAEVPLRMWKLQTLGVIYYDGDEGCDCSPAPLIDYKRAGMRRPLSLGY